MKGERYFKILDPREVKIPDVRIRAHFDPEVLEELKRSVKEVGTLEPILVVHDGDTYWLVDGQHRLEAALLAGKTEIPAVVYEGDLSDVMIMNLATSTMKGKTRPYDVFRMIRYLVEEKGMTVSEIAARTGMKPSYIERLLELRKCVPAVLDMLNEERIRLGHALELARVENAELQERLLALCLHYQPSVKDFHDIVSKAIEAYEAAKQAKVKEPEEQPQEEEVVETVRCHWCGREVPITEVRGFNLCMTCFSIAYPVVREYWERKRAAEAALQALPMPGVTVENLPVGRPDVRKSALPARSGGER